MNTQRERLTKKDEKFWKEFGQFPLFDLEGCLIDYNRKDDNSTEIQKQVSQQVVTLCSSKNKEGALLQERVKSIDAELKRLSEQYDKLDDELDRNPRMDRSEMRYISEQIQKLSLEKKILTGGK